MYRRIFVIALLLVVCVFGLASAQGTGNTLELGVTNSGVPSLVSPQGLTLYTFEQDQDGMSACYERCAEVWPPYLIDASSAPTLGAGLPGAIGTTQRTDGTLQVTYNGEPLYFFQQDMAPGDDFGHGRGAVWFAANPAAIMLGGNGQLGNFLVGPGGRTLYLFNQDMENESRCYDECTHFWPPALVRMGQLPLVGEGVTGVVTIITRDDGGQQLAYDGHPLYFFVGDRNPGEAVGHGVLELWFAAPPAGDPAPIPPTPETPVDATATPTTVGATATPGQGATPESTQEMTPEVTPETTSESTPEMTPPVEVTEEPTAEVTEAA